MLSCSMSDRKRLKLIRARDVRPDELRYWTLFTSLDAALDAAGETFRLHTTRPRPHDADNWNAIVLKNP